MCNEDTSINNASRLYNLKPIGIGTPYVESLTSYIKRLSEAHCVSPGILLSKEILPNLNKDYLTIRNYIGSESKKNINAMASETSEAIVGVLERKTCNNNLKYLTMSTWKKCFNASIRKNQAWCPICHEERLQQNKPIYEQLLWSLKDIDICGKHQVRLIQKCHCCNSELENFSHLARVGYCSKCNSWLGLKEYENSQISPIDAEWHNLAYNYVGQLLTITPTIEEVSNLQYSKNIISICDSFNISHRSLANEINVSHTTIGRWIFGNKPSLTDALGLSFRCGYSLCDIFTKDINILSGEPHNNIIVKKNTQNKIDMNEIKKALDEAINNNKGMSLKKLSNSLGVGYLTVKKYFPIEVIKLKASYDEYLANSKLNKSRLIENKMKLLLQRGIFPSRKALTRELGKRVINNDYYKKVWIDTLEEMGCTIDGDINVAE